MSEGLFIILEDKILFRNYRGDVLKLLIKQSKGEIG